MKNLRIQAFWASVLCVLLGMAVVSCTKGATNTQINGSGYGGGTPSRLSIEEFVKTFPHDVKTALYCRSVDPKLEAPANALNPSIKDLSSPVYEIRIATPNLLGAWKAEVTAKGDFLKSYGPFPVPGGGFQEVGAGLTGFHSDVGGDLLALYLNPDVMVLEKYMFGYMYLEAGATHEARNLLCELGEDFEALRTGTPKAESGGSITSSTFPTPADLEEVRPVAALAGRWASTCLPHQETGSKIAGLSQGWSSTRQWAYVLTRYFSDRSCSHATLNETTAMDFRYFGTGVSGDHLVEYTVNRVEYLPQEQGVAALFNVMRLCDIYPSPSDPGWEVLHVRDVSGRVCDGDAKISSGTTIFSPIHFENGNLPDFFGNALQRVP